jgi:flagellin-like hook-associated protein FlgL
MVAGNSAANAFRLCLGNEVYFYGSATLAQTPGNWNQTQLNSAISLGNTLSPASAVVSAINHNLNSQFWARLETGSASVYREGYTSIYIYAKEGGALTDVTGCDQYLGGVAGNPQLANQVMWYNDETENSDANGAFFGNGGRNWGTLLALPTGYGSFNLELHGRDSGAERDLRILNVGSGQTADISTSAGLSFVGPGFGLRSDGSPVTNLAGLNRESFTELQNAADGDWAGAHLRTQSHAQEALEAIQAALEHKEQIRATLGAYQNRLENTMNNLEIHAENLQTAESRISDTDMAAEMTRFVKNQVLTQAGIAMLSQTNSLPQMALSLLNG